MRVFLLSITSFDFLKCPAYFFKFLEKEKTPLISKMFPDLDLEFFKKTQDYPVLLLKLMPVARITLISGLPLSSVLGISA